MVQIRVASVQPRAHRRQEERHNLRIALRYLDEAAAEGARIVTFPEGFPGPYYDSLEWSAFEPIAEKALKHGTEYEADLQYVQRFLFGEEITQKVKLTPKLADQRALRLKKEADEAAEILLVSGQD